MTPGDLQAVLSLKARFTEMGDVVYRDLAEGLGLMHMGLAFHRDYLPNPVCNLLAQMIAIRYARFAAVEDLERVMKLMQEGITATHPNSPDLPEWLASLGGAV